MLLGIGFLKHWDPEFGFSIIRPRDAASDWLQIVIVTLAGQIVINRDIYPDPFEPKPRKVLRRNETLLETAKLSNDETIAKIFLKVVKKCKAHYI
jgi:hypothetical protein